MSGCLLCLEIRQDLVGGIKVQSTKWKELNVQNLIEIHFWPMEALQLSNSWLCSSCWQELFDFHKFYKRVKEAHAELSSTKKIVQPAKLAEDIQSEDFKLTIEKITFTETQFESAIPIKKSLRSEIFVPEEEIVIKEELNEEFLAEDTVPHSKKRNQYLIARQVKVAADDNKTVPEDPLSKKKQCRKRCDKNSGSISSMESKDGTNNSERNLNNPTKALAKIDKLQDDAEFLDINEDDPNIIDSCSDSNIDHDEDILDKEEKSSNGKLSSSSNHVNDKYLKENFQIKCSLCQTQAETFYALCKHFKMEHKMNGFVICCKKKFYRRSLLVDHVRQHVNPNYFKCTVCNKVMADRKCLNMHTKTHNVKKEKVHPCDICNKKFSMNMSLKLHKMSHLSEDEKHIPCTECGKKFASKSLLSNHVRSVHLKKYINICDICGRSIRCKEVFKRHMLKHEGKPLPTIGCDVCGLLLANKHSLKQHKLMVHPEGGKKEFTCPICSKISPNLKAHKKHIQYNHEWGNNHKCTMCDKAFKTAHTLTEHMATHTGTVLYTCPWCPKTFNSNANFHSHRKKSHRKQWEELTRKKYSGNLPPNNTVPANNTNNPYTSSDTSNIVKTEK